MKKIFVIFIIGLLFVVSGCKTDGYIKSDIGDTKIVYQGTVIRTEFSFNSFGPTGDGTLVLTEENKQCFRIKKHWNIKNGSYIKVLKQKKNKKYYRPESVFINGEKLITYETYLEKR